MKALIFAAGRGTRMRPLTDHTPKPLLVVGGKPLIVWHLEKLVAFGITEVFVNISHLAHCFAPLLGDGSRWGLRLNFIYEGVEPLETGGGMLNALPRLGDEPFIAINGDIWTDFDLMGLPREPDGLAHLVLVDNPEHHPRGDFALAANNRLLAEGTPRLTFAGIGVYRPELLDSWREVIGDAASSALQPPRFKLAPLLYAAIRTNQASGQHHSGRWTDVGTPARLAALDDHLKAPTVSN